MLKRFALGGSAVDATGCYPLFACENWDGLDADLNALAPEIVSVVLVTDPFGDYDERLLQRSFHRVALFKEHVVVDLRRFSEDTLTRHHRDRSRAALRRVTVDECADPSTMLDVWCALYQTLIERHGLHGLMAFSRDSFAQQLAVPGLRAFRAHADGEIVGMQLWFMHGDAAYSHLTAIAPAGYRTGAAYALQRVAIDSLAGDVRWLCLGAGAGVDSRPTGLTYFKAGWSNERKAAWLCGRICQPDQYKALAAATGRSESSYFPSYRGSDLHER